jgi:hypothetical protein
MLVLFVVSVFCDLIILSILSERVLPLLLQLKPCRHLNIKAIVTSQLRQELLVLGRKCCAQ